MLSLITFLLQYLLSTYYVPRVVLGTVVMVGEQMLSFIALWTPPPRPPLAFPAPCRGHHCKVDLERDLFSASI